MACEQQNLCHAIEKGVRELMYKKGLLFFMEMVSYRVGGKKPQTLRRKYLPYNMREGSTTASKT
jgi:hypothetical protein